jgi:GNAT superfamily N-acetyltransferase
MATAVLAPDELTLLHVEADDQEAVALIAGSLAELTARIGSDALADFDHRSRTEFAAWLGGDLVVLQRAGQTVAGGAYRRYDSTTVQLAWLWTRPDQRRTGLGRRVLAELEHSATWRGYRRVYAVAGPGQDESRQLLRSNRYTPLAAAGQGAMDYLGFVKELTRR